MATTPLPFTTRLQSRDGTTSTKDARITNLLIEPVSEGVIHLIKRPGFQLYENGPSAASLGSTTLPNGEMMTFSGVASGGANNATITITPGYSPYAMLSATAKSSHVALTNNNLTATSDGDLNSNIAKSTVYKSSGKWYCEYTITTAGASPEVGLINAAALTTYATGLGSTVNGYAYLSNGQKAHNSGGGAYGASWTTGDKISMLFDATAGTLSFWKNGADQGSAFTGITGSWTPAVSLYGTGVMTMKYGGTFAYSPTAGYLAWPNA